MLLDLDQLPRPVSSTPEVDALIRDGAAVILSVSGGKDSTASVIATWAYLDAMGHTGPRALIHADLGMVEWTESLPDCQALADRLGTELIVVRRAGGGLMERWESRWASSVRRYENLETVTLVMPWSSAQWRFCTSETKANPLTAELRRRYRGMPVLNVTGVRRQESSARAKATISKYEESNSRKDTPIYSWRPIADYTTSEVFETIARAGMKPHIAYTQYQATRLSCRFCILASGRDLEASARNSESHELYRRMVSLEARSSFGFQGNRWLGDVAPEILGDALQRDLGRGKAVAVARRAAEATIPKELLYVKGWPTRMITRAEAEILASVRREVCMLLGFKHEIVSADAVLGRYEELLVAKEAKGVVTPACSDPVQMTLDELLAAA